MIKLDLEANWNKHLLYLDEYTMDHIDEQIKEQTESISKSAMQSMNEIHYWLARALKKKDILKGIEEVESKYHNTSFTSVKWHIIKKRKDDYKRNPTEYREKFEEIQIFANKLREENNYGITR